jgi:3-dehydroquinate synthase class II
MEANLWLNFTGGKLIKAFNETNFITKTIEQINKDLSQVTELQISIEEIDKSNVHDSLCVQLTSILEEVENTMHSQVSQLLYLIDIPEHVIATIHQNPGTYHYNLAEVILRREAYKVYLRSKF